MAYVFLDHSIVGQSQTTLTINKEREYAACRICGAIYQSYLNTTQVSDEEYMADPLIAIAAQLETAEWRKQHNAKHSEAEHIAFQKSGRTFTPIAAHKLAPFGIVSVDHAPDDTEVVCALLEAPRAPVNDIETSPRGINVKY